jgi:negative regulator of replication initiation
MPTIRIDDEVWAYLKSKATPLEDSPNDVLRRELLGDVASIRETKRALLAEVKKHGGATAPWTSKAVKLFDKLDTLKTKKTRKKK